MIFRFMKISGIITLFFLSYNRLYADLPSSVEIIADKTTVMVSEPLILKIIYTFKSPQINLESDELLYEVFHNAELMIEIKDFDQKWISHNIEIMKKDNEGTEYYCTSLSPNTLKLWDNKGFTYGNYFIIFMNNVKQNIIFEEPGKYRVRLFVDKNYFSDVLNINVIPTDSTVNDHCILSDPNEYHFLMGSNIEIENRSKVMLHLKKLVKQCDQTLFSKWIAAQLGIEYYIAADCEKVNARREKKEVREDIFDQAIKYLSIATELPDDFPIREEVLYRLAEIEIEKHNYFKSLSYIEELGNKYPLGKYGKNASRHKNKIMKMQEKESKQAP